jgi:FAD/FMN-containing dehydrogenase
MAVLADRRRMASLLLFGGLSIQAWGQETLLNDPHSQLNPTWVAEVVEPKGSQQIIATVKAAARDGHAISISGGRHSMGGQQFGTGTVHISTRKLDDVVGFNEENGVVTVEAGILWPDLIDRLHALQDTPTRWGIVQKQTGADRLSVGGSVSSNIHGRGLTLRPFIQDIIALRLVDAKGEEIQLSRDENPELFRLVVGGYGLFGVITTVDLQLGRRTRLQRRVEIIGLDAFPEAIQRRIEAGHLYGDFQFKTDEAAADFLVSGVLSTYRPIDTSVPEPADQRYLSANDWRRLFAIAHYEKAAAFNAYVNFYLSTDGQLYWSDTHQLSYYDEDYEVYLRQNMPNYTAGSLMISELYVPRTRLVDFMRAVQADARRHELDIIYGTVRLIEHDHESFLAWARRDYACVIFNLRVTHDAAGIRKAQHDFQRLIDRALERGGSYFPTYHRWARKDQVLAAYPQFPEFLRMKLKYDPHEIFQSDWYRFYRRMFAKEISAPNVTD